MCDFWPKGGDTRGWQTNFLPVYFANAQYRGLTPVQSVSVPVSAWTLHKARRTVRKLKSLANRGKKRATELGSTFTVTCHDARNLPEAHLHGRHCIAQSMRVAPHRLECHFFRGMDFGLFRHPRCLANQTLDLEIHIEVHANVANNRSVHLCRAKMRQLLLLVGRYAQGGGTDESFLAHREVLQLQR
ncbi:MAG: hypothetical protein ACRC56_02660 [Bosea sp. (in: a-proteobacteria)]